MKVLHLVCAKVWGGGEQYVFDIAASLKTQNVKSIIAVDAQNITFQEKYKEVGDVIPTSLYSLSGLPAFSTLKKIIKKENIDIINVHSGKLTLLGILLKKSLNIPVVLFKHSATPGKSDVYHKWIAKQLDAIICVSKLVYNLQKPALDNSQVHKLHLVYNGILADRLNESPNDSLRLPSLDNPFYIGYAGRLAENKGIATLIKCIHSLKKEHPQVHLLLAGMPEKNYDHYLRELIKDLQLESSVTFLGLVNHIGDFYKHLNVFVLPSKVKESFGLVLCEAMYSKVYTITTNSGAQSEIITDKVDGRILEPFNEDTLAHAIEFAIKHPQEIQQMAEQAHLKVINNFTIDKTTKNLLSIFKNIIGIK
ncbi:MAG: glycosyltransferase family 4 protein [Veillonella sp.]|uniref:glycosyltransferase family 4 protein n=1 Tax=Veillonella sp. TaxID=1926307 RepID=UPI0025E4DC84|nr:glycosyltransferase family 4 protein [Veillonella sp.]MBS4913664.1 glycosyltransferase family 4 protein [Veillonella sp.]